MSDWGGLFLSVTATVALLGTCSSAAGSPTTLNTMVMLHMLDHGILTQLTAVTGHVMGIVGVQGQTRAARG